MSLFKKRILGLVSYFPDVEKLLPNYNRERDFHLVKLEMSPHQFHIYNLARVGERKLEELNRKKKKKQTIGGEKLYEGTTSTYRIFSRAYCNFVFPDGIIRPLPGQKNNIEEVISIAADEDILDAVKGKNDEEEAEEKSSLQELEENRPLGEKEISLKDTGELEKINTSYEQRIKDVLAKLNEESVMRDFLAYDKLYTYSPKFHKILENLDVNGTDNYPGLHLIYSQFRTLEGIGIFSIVLKANGFVQFKIKKVNGKYQLDIKPEDIGKPKFVLYTGTEDDEEKEIIRNIFNSTWEYVPSELREQISGLSPNNFFGEIIKIIMITASGAEGISLKNVRYVHILEPYWHPVRTEQIIGRARRICSHNDLPDKPKNLQTVQVFLYLMIFSKAQIEDDAYKEIRASSDLSKRKYERYSYEELLGDERYERGKSGKRELKFIPFTSDETLYEISTRKELINKDILQNIKEASIDCVVHAGTSTGKKVNCFSFGAKPSPNSFSYNPVIGHDETDIEAAGNVRKVKIPIAEIELGSGENKKRYALAKNPDETGKNRKVYDLGEYNNGNQVEVGVLTKLEQGGFKFDLI